MEHAGGSDGGGIAVRLPYQFTANHRKKSRRRLKSFRSSLFQKAGGSPEGEALWSLTAVWEISFSRRFFQG